MKKRKTNLTFSMEETDEKQKIDHLIQYNDSKVLTKNEINHQDDDYVMKFRNSGGGSSGHGPRGRSMYTGKKATNIKGTISRIWSYLKVHDVELLVVSVSIVIATVLSLVIPSVFAIAIGDNGVVENFDYNGILVAFFTIIFFAMFAAVFRWLYGFIMVKVSQNVVKKIRQDAFDKLQKLPIKYYDQKQSGDIMSVITNDIELISNSLRNSVVQLISSVISLLGALIFMLVYSWELTLVVLTFIPLIMLFVGSVMKKSMKYFSQQQSHLGLLNGHVEEVIGGMKVIKLYGQEENAINEFMEHNNNLKHSAFKAQAISGILMPSMGFFTNVIFVSTIAVGAFMYLRFNWVSITAVIAVSMYSRQFIQPIANVTQLMNQIQQAIAGAERVFTLLDEETEYLVDGYTEVDNLHGDFVFDHVNFGYEKDKPVLRDITFTAKAGETIAIVGPTGSGKTTIINLINRFYDVDSGEIKIDQTNINSLKKDELRKHIGIVLQDTYLFSGSVYENIAYGKETSSKEEVIKAAKLANAHDFITTLPDGYDSNVYEGGQNFSQGERQLISIARTLLSDPDVLILDEATSNVDTRTETKIQESMFKLMENRTSFVIAHRLQTIKNADKILVIKDGLLIETGSHDILIKEKGFYYDLYTTQFKNATL